MRCTVACFLGFSLWLALRIHYGDYVRNIIIPLQVQGDHAAFVVAPEVVSITVTGPWSVVGDFINQNPIVFVNSAILRKGMQEVSITTDQLQLPAELRMIHAPVIPVFVNPNT